MSESLALVKSESTTALSVAQDMPTAFVPRSFAEAQSFAKALAESSLVPTALRNSAANVLMTIMAGAELGIAPIASMRLFHVIEGVPKLTADGIAGLCQRARACEYLRPKKGARQDAESVTWVAKRADSDEEIEITWTREDVKRAGLWDRKDKYGNPGQHQKYPRQMLNARAKAELCRLTWPEICGGMLSAEEQRDVDAIDAEFVEIPASNFQPLQHALPAANPTVVEPKREAKLSAEAIKAQSEGMADDAIAAITAEQARAEALAKAADAARELETIKLREAQERDAKRDAEPTSPAERAAHRDPMPSQGPGSAAGEVGDNASRENFTRGYPIPPALCTTEDIDNLETEINKCETSSALNALAARIAKLAMSEAHKSALMSIYKARRTIVQRKEGAK